MILAYKAPVKVHKFNRRWVLRDPLNKEVIEFAQNSYALDYEKRMIERMQFIADLMNGRKSIRFEKGEYVMHIHPEAPEAPAANPQIPGLIANAEQAMVERIIKEQRLKEGEPTPPFIQKPVEEIIPKDIHKPIFEEPEEAHVKAKPSIMEKVKEAVKKRGRPKKK